MSNNLPHILALIYNIILNCLDEIQFITFTLTFIVVAEYWIALLLPDSSSDINWKKYTFMIFYF